MFRKLKSKNHGLSPGDLKVKDHLIWFSSLKSTTGNVPPDNFYKDLLKTQISELENQLSEKTSTMDIFGFTTHH